MGPKKDVIDIVTELGGIKTNESAQKLIEERLDATNLSKLSLIKNESVLRKIANAIVLCDPDSVFINTASDEDRQFIRQNLRDQRDRRNFGPRVSRRRRKKSH